MKLYLRSELAIAWQNEEPFQRAAHQPGQIYRAREGRRTLQFEINGRSYFLKYHAGIGWREIFKNLFQGKAPVLGAMQEVRAIRRVEQAGLDTMTIAGFGERGRNPARRESFIVTDDLRDTISLEEWGDQWYRSPGAPAFKWALIRRVANIARRMHEAGVNHRDFYLGHFLIPRTAIEAGDAEAPIYLIDLHRSQVRQRVPLRWRVKDLGGLYFSTARLGLTQRDVLRFLRVYAADMPLRDYLREHRDMLARCQREGEKIYRRYFEIEPAFPLQFCEHPGKDI